MRYSKVHLTAIGYELGPVVVTSEELETRLETLYKSLHIQPGQLEALTGIEERRWWEPNTPLSHGAAVAGRKALEVAGMEASDISTLVYAGVCREYYEPATACRVANGLGLNSKATIYDLSNACLGVLNAIIEVANQIELGQIRAGMVVSNETAREVNETMISRMLEEKSMGFYMAGLTTFTGGSGAVAVLLTDGSFTNVHQHRLLGGVSRTAPEFHNLCRWGTETGPDGQLRPFMATDSVTLLKEGIRLFGQTWIDFLTEMSWTKSDVDKVICHQIAAENQKQIRGAIEMPVEKDFTSFEFLGNMGTVSLPVTAAIAEERGFFDPGDRVGFLGVGSGLNTLMLGLEW